MKSEEAQREAQIISQRKAQAKIKAQIKADEVARAKAKAEATRREIEIKAKRQSSRVLLESLNSASNAVEKRLSTPKKSR